MKGAKIPKDIPEYNIVKIQKQIGILIGFSWIF